MCGVDPTKLACNACLGGLYETCKGCYAGLRRRNLLMSMPDQEPEAQLQQCKLDTMGKFGTDLIQEEEHLLAVFECLHEDGRNAKLSLSEACDIVGCNKTTMEVFESAFNMTDTNGDGFITIGEFDSGLAKHDSTLSNVSDATSMTTIASPAPAKPTASALQLAAPIGIVLGSVVAAIAV